MVVSSTRIGQSFSCQFATCQLSISSSYPSPSPSQLLRRHNNNHNHNQPTYNTIMYIQGIKHSSSLVVRQCSGSSSTPSTSFHDFNLQRDNYPFHDSMGFKKLEETPLQEEEEEEERSSLLFSSRDTIQYCSKGGYDEMRIHELVACIKGKINEGKLANGGEISISSYDTTWVSRIPCVNDVNHPQFPGTLQWILQHQIVDGSWGEETYFQTYDRIVSTLACVIALKIWNLSPPSINKGVEFLWRNFEKLQYESLDHMLCGFKLIVTSMLEEAQDLGLDLPYNYEFVNRLMKICVDKFQRLPIELIHNYPTTILYSLEGLTGLIDCNGNFGASINIWIISHLPNFYIICVLAYKRPKMPRLLKIHTFPL